MSGGEEPSTAAAHRLSRSTSLFLFRPSACLECDEVEPDEALECAVCMSLFIEPIIFPGCSHSFCRLCLLRLQMHAAFRCPLCRCHSSLTVSELTRWPVARELRSRAKAAAPALYEKRSHDHKQRIACLLREHAVKRLQDKCPYRGHAPVRFSRTNVPWRFTPVTNCLDAVCRCLGRRWCAGLRSYAARYIGFGRARWAQETPVQYAVASGCALPSPPCACQRASLLSSNAFQRCRSCAQAGVPLLLLPHVSPGAPAHTRHSLLRTLDAPHTPHTVRAVSAVPPHDSSFPRPPPSSSSTHSWSRPTATDGGRSHAVYKAVYNYSIA